MDELDRYSNTLLVSLNNRISIRESVATSGLTFRTLPVTSIGHRSEHSSDAMIMRPPAAKAYKARTLADNEEHEKMVVLVTRETQSVSQGAGGEIFEGQDRKSDCGEERVEKNGDYPSGGFRSSFIYTQNTV
jgi:hypothetical protein